MPATDSAAARTPTEASPSAAGALPPSLARAHAWARGQPWLARFTLANRLLLAMAFLPTGMVKLLGERFTVLPIENSVGFFFEAMYRTGPYWHFIGAVQVLAAVLLLVPRTALLGALLFLPVSVSILLITWGIGFGNTVFVVAGMVLSVVYLLCWDADRLWVAAAPLVRRAPGPALLADAHPVEWGGWLLGGIVGMALWMTTRGFVPRSWILTLLVMGVVAVCLVVLGWVLTMARRRTQR